MSPHTITSSVMVVELFVRYFAQERWPLPNPGKEGGCGGEIFQPPFLSPLISCTEPSCHTDQNPRGYSQQSLAF